MLYKSVLLGISTLLSLWGLGSWYYPPSDEDNLVPNPSFESFSILPHGWFYRGSDFSSLVKDWSSASEASPDVYGPNITVPDTWQDKGFGKKEPRSGEYMVGITCFGCEQGKPHCREYLQVNLKEPLVPGQAYHVEFWASPLHTGMHANNLGIYFSERKLQEKTDRLVPRNPQVFSKKIIPGDQYLWHKVQGDFTAEKPCKFLIIGNFESDDSTQSRSHALNTQPFAYYYIDDVNVHKRPPLVEGVEDEFTDWYPLVEDRVIPLKNVLFDTDKSTIKKQGRSDLDKLIRLLREYPTMEVEVGGHTDHDGGFEYNIRLSNRRARAVVHYLTQRGIEESRLTYIGYGTTRPIATNQTEEGKQQNRRVEFRIRTI